MDRDRTDQVTGRAPEGLDIPVAPLPGSGRGGRSRAPIVTALAITGAALAAIALAQLFPTAQDGPVVEPPPIADVLPSPSPSRSPGPGPIAAVESTAPRASVGMPPRLRPADLVEGVLSGLLDGRLLYADATLVSGCPSGSWTCAEPPRIAGLGLDVTLGPPAAGTLRTVPDNAVLVLAIRGPRLEYLGSLVAHPDGSPTLEQLTAEALAPTSRQTQTLFDAGGWLVTRPACVTPGGGLARCLDRRPFLADDAPLADGIIRSNRGQEVTLSPALWGVDAARDTVVSGPFIVRPGHSRDPDDPAWEIVARYDPALSVRVVIP